MTDEAAWQDAVPFTGKIPPKGERQRFTLAPFDQIELITTTPYLVKGLIPREGLAVVWGPPKCGKSFSTFDLTMHVALGWDYRGRRVAQGTVVYVECEGAHGPRARIEAFRQRHLADETADIPFFLVPSTLDLVGERAELIAAIRAEVGEIDPSAVVLDTLNRSIRGSESLDEDMGNYVRAVDRVREAFGCAVIVVHHCGVDGSRPRGHTSLTGAADAQIAVKRDDGGTVTATVEWMKDGPEGDQVFSRLETVDVGTDEDGETITSCVVVAAEKTEGEANKRLKGKAKSHSTCWWMRSLNTAKRRLRAAEFRRTKKLSGRTAGETTASKARSRVRTKRTARPGLSAGRPRGCKSKVL